MPDGPQQPDLARPLEHAEREGDRDPEDGDHDGERQQGGDDEEQLVELGLLRRQELGVALHVGLRERLHGGCHGRITGGGSTPSASLAMMNRSRAGASLTPASVSRLISQLPNVASP